MQKMRVAFSDFYSGYEKDMIKNPITNYFATSSDWEIVSLKDNPDLIVCSVFGKNHTKYPDTNKLMWAAENMARGQSWNKISSFDGIDWIFLNNHREAVDLPTSAKDFYLPYAGIHYDMDQIKSWHEQNIRKEKTKFCCFVSSGSGNHDGYGLRNNFFKLVNSKYKHVDSGGRVLNNIGYLVPRDDSYIDWVADYKFMICFENSQGDGYLTEKIFTPYAAGTVPIYWGDLTNFDLINKNACLFHTTPEETLIKLMLLDKSPLVYEVFREKSIFVPEKEELLSRQYLKKIFDQVTTEIKS